MATDSLKKRYSSKLLSKLISFGLGFITIGIVPRVLGPAQYGNFSFLNFFFTKVIKFLQFGTSSAFLTKLSSRQKEYKIIGFYIYYILLVLFLLSIGILGVFILDFNSVVWPEQENSFIWLAAGLALSGFISTFIHEINDAYGFTVKMELFFVLQSILATSLILLLYFTNSLNLTTYFFYHYIILLFVIVAGIRILHYDKVFIFRQFRILKKDLIKYINEFYRYSYPLVIHSIIVLFVGIGDRWILQYFSGAAEQGYFGLAFKIGAICFLFTSSMTPLIIREMSISFIKDRLDKMAVLFKKSIPLFYFIATYFAVFISLNASFISIMIGGDKYKEAIAVVTIMAYYPIHQTYGQLSGSVFLASNQTKLIRNIGVTTGLIGIILSFILIVPAPYGGMGMGAVGLAIKMVIIQFFAVNIQLWFNSRFLNISFLWFFLNQIIVFGILLSLGWISRLILSILIDNLIFQFILSGFLYSILTLCVIYLFPKLIAQSRKNLNNYFSEAINKIYFIKKSIINK